MRCAIHQPNFFPRLTTLTKIASADVWIVLDDVQFTRRDYQHRACIAPPASPRKQRWLTLPVHLPHGRATHINNVELADPAATCIRTYRVLQQHYRRSPGWSTVHQLALPALDAIAGGLLSPAAEASTRSLLGLLRWQGSIYHSSDFTVRDGRSERLADLAAAIGASTYICGRGGANYLESEPFTRHGVNIEYQRVPVLQHGPDQRDEHDENARRVPGQTAATMRLSALHHVAQNEGPTQTWLNLSPS